MNSKKIGILILIILASLIPEARALTPQSQTLKITDTKDDRWITELGVGIDSTLVTVKDPGMDLRAYLVFRELDINYWEPLKNATLRLHTASSLPSDPDNSITIYGIKLSDLQLEGFLTASTVLSLGFTEAHTNYNTSEFSGNKWNDIDVTDIIEELIRNPNWDGDGIAGTETGDAIGFHILGAEGDDKRYFYDLLAGNGLEAQLIIHWNHEPPPPSGYEEWEFVKIHGNNFTIWNYTSYATWLNYSSFTLTNPTGNIQNLNDTYFEYITYYEDDNDYLRKDFSQTTGIVNRKFGITYLHFVDTSASESSAVVMHWGISQNTASPWGPPYWDEGYSIVTLQSAGGQLAKLQVIVWTSGSHLQHIDLHPYWVDTDLPATIWVNPIINLDTGEYSINIYNDAEMTDLNDTNTGTFTGGGADASTFTKEFAIGPTSLTSANRDWESGYHHSLSDFEDEVTFMVSDENGTVLIDDLTSLEDAEDWIEVFEVNPEDPNPGGQWEDTGPFTRFRTRLYILLLGIALIFGPLMYFAYSRPSGYEFVIGLFIMLIGLAFMIASGSI